jgi:hypothetical protein
LRCSACHSLHYWARNRKRHWVHGVVVSPLILLYTIDSADRDCSAMANVPISGALAEKYGYLSLSIFSGITVLVGGAILVTARLVQNREWRAIV